MEDTLPKLISTALILCVVGATFNSIPAHAAKMYKWVDADGNVFYQDQPPPEEGKLLKESLINQKASSTESEQSQEPVVIYTVVNCESCTSIVAKLAEMGIPFEEKSLRDDREAQARILEESGGLSAPTLFVRGKLVVAPSPEILFAVLSDAGYNLSDEGNSVNSPQTSNVESSETTL